MLFLHVGDLMQHAFQITNCMRFLYRKTRIIKMFHQNDQRVADPTKLFAVACNLVDQSLLRGIIGRLTEINGDLTEPKARS